MNKTDIQKMKQRQSLPIEAKIQMTKSRIKDWYEHWDGDVYLAFSGGKDSTVLKHVIESMGYNIPCVFSNTGLEMPEIVKFARAQNNVVEIRPKMTYDKVWKTEGLPVGSKRVAKQIRTLSDETKKGTATFNLYDKGITSKGFHAPRWKLAKKWRKFVDNDIKVSEKCCDHLKKEPFKSYEKESGLWSFSAMMADEGGERANLTNCNNFDSGRPISHPMLFWLEKDIWEYIELFNVEICSVYFDRDVDFNGEKVTIKGEKRTGCMFCSFGVQMEKGVNRFQKMSVTHPRQHAIVMDRMGMREAMEMINVKVDYEFECDSCKKSSSKHPYCQHKGCKNEQEEQAV